MLFYRKIFAGQAYPAHPAQIMIPRAFLRGEAQAMRQTQADTDTAVPAQTDTTPSGFWARARELADWMEEQDGVTN